MCEMSISKFVSTIKQIIYIWKQFIANGKGFDTVHHFHSIYDSMCIKYICSINWCMLSYDRICYPICWTAQSTIKDISGTDDVATKYIGCYVLLSDEDGEKYLL